MRVLIVDDEVDACDRMRTLLEAMPDVFVQGCEHSVESAVDSIIDDPPDMVLLDVQIRGGTGFDVVRSVGANRMPPTVFITAYDQYAVNAFEVRAVDYLLKPVEQERLRSAIDRVTQQSSVELERLSDRLEKLLHSISPGRTPASAPPSADISDWILVKNAEGTMRLLATDDIEWIEAAGNYVYLHSDGAKHLHRETLRSLLAHLNPHKFVRIHRSAIVNLAFIESISAWFAGDYHIKLKTGAQLKLSRFYREDFDRRVAKGV